MRFGASSWFFQEYSVSKALTYILECGFQAAEIWMEHLWSTEESPEEIARHARDLDMELTLHSTSYDLNIISTNPGIRHESLRQVKQSIVLAKRLDAKLVVVHPGRLSSSKGDVEKGWTVLQDTFALINTWAQRQNLLVGIEAMEKQPGQLYMLPEHVHQMVNRGWTNLGLTLDIAHTFTHMDPVKYIRQLDRQWIAHVHLSDGSRRSTHLPLGQGEINIDAALRELHTIYDGLVILEGVVLSHGQDIVSHNRTYLQKLGWM
jgi:sugar phosphate isomerase/epimerase